MFRRSRPFLLGLVLAACAQAPPPVEQPTLCQLAEAREDFAGRTLTVEGYLLASGHGNSIADPHCGYGVGIGWRDGDGGDMDALGVAADRMRAEPWMVRVRVTGTMRQDDHDGPVGRIWQLRLTAAEVMSAQRLPDDDGERYLRWLDGPSPEPFHPNR